MIQISFYTSRNYAKLFNISVKKFGNQFSLKKVSIFSKVIVTLGNQATQNYEQSCLSKYTLE